MRTKSIISIIRRYGLSSKRLHPKNRIRYEDAVKAMKQYENEEIKIDRLVDNQLFPSKSVSCRCQIPGCNHHIRYEYILKNKQSGDEIVAGSTCVWPLLGFSETQKKEFLSYEKAIKEHSDKIEWEKENQDVIDKLNRLRDDGFYFFRPFWEEVQYCRLIDEDTQYIKSIDVDQLIQNREEKKRKERERKEAAELSRQKELEVISSPEYQRVLDALEKLSGKFPNNYFYKDLQNASRRRPLSRKQISCIKNDMNALWYEENIKGTSNDLMSDCDDILKDLFAEEGYPMGLIRESKDVEKINLVLQKPDVPTRLKNAWVSYKVKYRLAF